MLSAADSHSGLFLHAELPQPQRRKSLLEPAPLVPLDAIPAAEPSPPARLLPRLAIAADSSTPSGVIDLSALRYAPGSAAAFVAHRLVATTPALTPAPSRALSNGRALLVTTLVLLTVVVGVLVYLALAVAASYVGV